MNLFEQTKPLKIIHPIGGERIIASLFPAPNGLYFFDVGWYDPYGMSGNCIHFVKGKIEGDGPWIIKGDGMESKIEIMKDNDRLMSQALEWKKYIDGIKLKRSQFDILLNDLVQDEKKELLKWYKDNDITIR